VSWLDKQLPGEPMGEFVQRLHDEAHGPACTCSGNPGRRTGRIMPLPGVEMDTTEEGKRVELAGGKPEIAQETEPE
jgi:hypothetical protein